MPLSLLLCHGWGFDAALWDALAALLPEFERMRDDAGYFGDATSAAPVEPCIAITHSLGTMRLLAAPPPGLVALVAVNGFDRFTAADRFPGTPVRVLDRMIGAFAQDPGTVLTEFRKRCGCTVPARGLHAGPLERDLRILRDGDARGAAKALSVPILSLQGERDPILSPAMRESVFAGARHIMRRTHPAAGHLLPCEEPAWCAEAIRTFAGTLA
jgi:pimeloyl-[acyl-carrier protein] methyl ester esterase